jgi:hypothetical protein
MPAITLAGLLALKYWILLLAYVPWPSQPNSKVKYYFSNRVQCQNNIIDSGDPQLQIENWFFLKSGFSYTIENARLSITRLPPMGTTPGLLEMQ